MNSSDYKGYPDNFRPDAISGEAAAREAPPFSKTELDVLVDTYVSQTWTGWNGFVGDFTHRANKVLEDDRVTVASIEGEYQSAEDRIKAKYTARAPAADIPEQIDLSEAFMLPSFKNNWWKVAIGFFIIAWIAIGFFTGLLAAVAGLFGFAAILQSKQHKLVSERVQEIDEQQYLYESEQKSIVNEHDQALRTKHEKLTEHAAKIGRQKQVLAAEWEERCTSFNQELHAIDQQLAEMVARGGSRLTPIETSDKIADEITDLDEQLRFRIGEVDLHPPTRVDKELVLSLGLRTRLATLTTRYPWMHSLQQHRALLIDGKKTAAAQADVKLFYTVIARILRQFPPGKTTFTLIDPLGLGANFSPFLKLQDYSDTLINGTVWTNREQIKRRLRDTIEHIEIVTQKYLRADFPDIESYNREAEEIAEAYRFLCVADFPEAFDQEAVRDLVKIIQNGPRCGVHTLLYLNANADLDYGVNLEELKDSCDWLVLGQGQRGLYLRTSGDWPNEEVHLDLQPSNEYIKRLVDSFGSGAVDAMKVEVPFAKLGELAQLDSGKWTESSAEGILVPLGPSGAKKALTMTLDSKMSHNALIVGRPGSGKSNLLHVFIAMTCGRYSPDEVELYLVDFKKGVEFKDYANARLPHARVIAVESEREFGLSVLQALDKEMTRRSGLFKQAQAAENISGYRKHEPEARMPRAVLIVDEYQEFFSRDDKINREATTLLDRIVRQGRGFGMHVILGTQSLSNSGLPRSTIDQIPIRIALQCSEADSRQILADDNLVARSLSRPGEAIYNDKGGLLEGNRQFQVALFESSARKAQLAKLLEFAEQENWDGDPPRIFEGHESAAIKTCSPLRHFVAGKRSSTLKTWLGEPVSLDDPVSASFAPQAGRNMLVISRDEAQGTNVILSSLASMAAQLTPRDLKLHIVDLTTADAAWADFPEALRDAMPHAISICGRHGMRELLLELRNEVIVRHKKADARSDTASEFGQRTVLAIIGAHRARDLRQDDEPTSIFAEPDADAAPSAALCLKEIVAEGPDVGMHTLLWLDSYANFERIFDRRVLSEFGVRVSASLPERDSQTLYDSLVAAQIDRPNRMVKYDDDLVGVHALFRPYTINAESDLWDLSATLFPDQQVESLDG
ncbi:FtsK/SpoIIIE family protein [Ciceribacter lividus]|uniref:FtsK/SpoIIIE family protein n=1 Tax=Ciceribacter lividus TaxID=1197950 RepID=A0A6I7HHC4_9HYPH|nr:FtsK/SpoIIIE domain-containing protein [Ciceribacter lividus]RCW19803.1 FtsK/SpoIIIE family protein [Ciceribacter lividus]